MLEALLDALMDAMIVCMATGLGLPAIPPPEIEIRDQVYAMIPAENGWFDSVMPVSGAYNEGVIYITKTDERWMITVMAHELGHALLEHAGGSDQPLKHSLVRSWARICKLKTSPPRLPPHPSK